MKRDDLGLANELSAIGQKIYAIGSLIGSNSETGTDPTETNNGIFLILADLSKRLEKISLDVETQALALSKKRQRKVERKPLILLKEEAVS